MYLIKLFFAIVLISYHKLLKRRKLVNLCKDLLFCDIYGRINENQLDVLLFFQLLKSQIFIDKVFILVLILIGVVSIF
jgi:hypothetical protein